MTGEDIEKAKRSCCFMVDEVEEIKKQKRETKKNGKRKDNKTNRGRTFQKTG
jgi:hypothetical protein